MHAMLLTRFVLPLAGEVSTAPAPVTSSGEFGMDVQPAPDTQGAPDETTDNGQGAEASDEAAEGKLRRGEEFWGIYSSEEAQRAIWAAKRCEALRTWLEEDDDDQLQRDREWQEDAYMDALVDLNEMYSDSACCIYFEIGGCTHGRACACGRMRAPWPWIVHRPGGPFCRCFVHAERLAWTTRASLHRCKSGLFGLQRSHWPGAVKAANVIRAQGIAYEIK
jgi:hypothetical protein